MEAAVKQFRKRNAILACLQGTTSHPSAEMVYEMLQKEHPDISLATVYRNLALLSKSGQITHVKVPTADRFDARLDRHYHLLCTNCGRVFDAPVPYHPEYDDQVSKETGFQISRHRMIF